MNNFPFLGWLLIPLTVVENKKSQADVIQNRGNGKGSAVGLMSRISLLPASLQFSLKIY